MGPVYSVEVWFSFGCESFLKSIVLLVLSLLLSFLLFQFNCSTTLCVGQVSSLWCLLCVDLFHEVKIFLNVNIFLIP
jgi:hypothetical protein